MGDDLLDSMLGDVLDGNEDERGSSSGDLGDLLGGLMGSQAPEEGSGGTVQNLLGGLFGGGEQGGDIGSLLGTLLGGAESEQQGESMLGDMLGGSGAGGQDLNQIPVIGPMLQEISEKYGIPSSLVAALLNGVIQMIASGKLGGRSVDLANLTERSTAQDIAKEVAGEVGLDENTATNVVQEIFSKLLQ
jgi:hypothetical protein